MAMGTAGKSGGTAAAGQDEWPLIGQSGFCLNCGGQFVGMY